jgi:hypothetical protein
MLYINRKCACGGRRHVFVDRGEGFDGRTQNAKHKTNASEEHGINRAENILRWNQAYRNGCYSAVG